MKLTVFPAERPLEGELRPPGDKSVSHRAILLGAIATGQTVIHDWLESEDTVATRNAVQALGARTAQEGQTLLVTGGQLSPPPKALDMGNSGTGIRLLAGLLCGQASWEGARAVLAGDPSLSRRPMARIIRPLTAMGAQIESREGLPPLSVAGVRLSGADHQLPVASAQVKSAVLLAGLHARGTTRLSEPGLSRNHTELMLPAFGVRIGTTGSGLVIEGGQAVEAAEIQVPGDLSAAAFALVAASLVAGSDVLIEQVGLNPSRDGVLRILAAMGADLTTRTLDVPGNEPVGCIRVRASRLVGIDIPPDWVPLSIDEFPVIMAAAAVARGTTRIRGAAELRVKESDRLAAMCGNLRNLGVAVEETPDGAVIQGGRVSGGRVETGGDHRIAMSMAVLALVADGPVEIADAGWIATSYPGFARDMGLLGARMTTEVHDCSQEQQ